MGIYRNESVNSLPEQVQENKENIKQINEILENIDPDQVATILSDIQALKAEQVVQNTAIGTNTANIGLNTTAIELNTTAISNEKTTREGLIYKNTNNQSTNIDNEDGDINIVTHEAFNVTAYSEVYLQDDNGHSLAMDLSGFAFNTNDHNLTFTNDGKLKVDGVEVGGGGGGTQLYRHCITLIDTNPSNQIQMSFDIISSSNAVFDTRQKIATYLNSNSLNSYTSCLGISGFYYDATNMYWAVGIFASNNINPQIRTFTNNHTLLDIQIPSVTIYDKVITL